MIDELNQLISRCKAGVHLTVNEHRNYYESAAKYLEGLKLGRCTA